MSSQKQLIRFIVAGNVDDGKSTFIGRLLYDSKVIYDDQLADVSRASEKKGLQVLDLSLFTDGLQEERNKNITIDVAYRYFSTEHRKFIIGDVPGHRQFTPNMVTAASTADLAIILIDATKGILEQTKAHLFIASLLGMSQILIVVNKMDLMAYQMNVYEKISSEVKDYLSKIGVSNVMCIPASAKLGSMVVHRDNHMPWYQGKTVLEHLEQFLPKRFEIQGGFRFPIQLPIKLNSKVYGFAGQIESGKIQVQDEIMILPSRRRSKVCSIISVKGEVACSQAGSSVVLILEDQEDIQRGDMVVSIENCLQVSRDIKACIFWMSQCPLLKGETFLMKHTTKVTSGYIEEFQEVIDTNSLFHQNEPQIAFNQAAKVRIHCKDPLMVDPYVKSRNTGNFIMIDQKSYNTNGAGIVLLE